MPESNDEEKNTDALTQSTNDVEEEQFAEDELDAIMEELDSIDAGDPPAEETKASAEAASSDAEKDSEDEEPESVESKSEEDDSDFSDDEDDLEELEASADESESDDEDDDDNDDFEDSADSLDDSVFEDESDDEEIADVHPIKKELPAKQVSTLPKKKVSNTVKDQSLTMELTGSINMNLRFETSGKQVELLCTEDALICRFGDGTEVKIPTDNPAATSLKKSA